MPNTGKKSNLFCTFLNFRASQIVFLPGMRSILVVLLFFCLAACSRGTNTPTPELVPTATLPARQSPNSSAAPAATSRTPATLNPTPSATATATLENSASPTTGALTASPTQAASTPAENVTGGIPDPNLYTWQLIINGLNAPVGLANAGDGSGRLFVLEKSGLIRIVKDGTLSPTPFLDITDRVGSQGSEQGLLGLAFHPQYRENGYFFVNYTDVNGDTVIARYQVSPGDPQSADPGSELLLLHVNQPYANHNGGEVTFGPDGYLYLGLGDGGSGGDPQGNGQSLRTLLGKILRLDVDHGDPYTIPADNPFANGTNANEAKPEIWAYGLRNPWRFSFDARTRDLYIADVGQNQWEEIDYLPAGSPGGTNFGWNYFEGNHSFNGDPPADVQIVMPVAEYDHSLGCSVTGGFVYNGAQLPDWQGVYIYGDYCSGNIWGLKRDAQGNWQNIQLYQNVARISSFGTDESGEVYLADLTGNLFLLSKK